VCGRNGYYYTQFSENVKHYFSIFQIFLKNGPDSTTFINITQSDGCKLIMFLL
jgi:hypothetical protein